MKLTRRITILIVIMAAGVSLAALAVGWFRSPYTVSAETTRLVEPLREDGSVDFFAAVTGPLSEGVTPQNNAAVLLWQATGPPDWDDPSGGSMFESFFAALGISPLAAEGEYFVALDDYAKQLDPRPAPPADPQAGTRSGSADGAPQTTSTANSASEVDGPDPLNTRKDPRLQWGGLLTAWPARGNVEPGWTGVLREQYREARMRPWSPEEFPELDDWLTRNDGPLRLAREASLRSRCYSPLISGGEIPELATVQKPQLQLQQPVMALAARAMLRVGGGQAEEAWQDIMALYRLARLLAAGPWVVDLELALELERAACACTVAASFHGALSEQQILAARSNLRDLTAFPRTANRLDLQRYLHLERMCAAARGDVQARDQVFGETSADLPRSDRIDWDELLRNLNGFYDLVVQAAQQADVAQRESVLLEINSLTQQARASLREDDAAGQQVWSVVLARSAPADVSSLLKAETQAALMLRMADLALILAAHHASQGSYPQQLEDLVPHQLDEIPIDPWCGAQLIYHSDGTACCFYSIGTDGFDEGGSFFRDTVVWSPYPEHEAISTLIWRLKSRAREVCYPAAAALVQRGEQAIPALEATQRDGDPGAQEGATLVLDAIRASESSPNE